MKFLSSNKKVVMICVLLVIFCTFFLIYMQKKYFIKEENVILKNDTKTHIINSNAITMMYETVSGSGEYETTTDTLCLGKDIFLMKDYQAVRMVELLLGIARQIK